MKQLYDEDGNVVEVPSEEELAEIRSKAEKAAELEESLAEKEAELKKVASNINFSGSMSMSSDDNDESGQSHSNSTVNFSGNDFESFEQDHFSWSKPPMHS